MLSETDLIPFAIPDIGDEEIEEVIDSLKSGWITTGPKAKKFEEDFSDFLGCGVSSVSVNSATSGLHLGLEALGVGPGDEVLLPTYTFTSTAEVVRYLGATPIFVDSDPKTFNISLKDLERKINAKSKAIIPVHFAGQAADMDGVLTIARDNNLKVVEDAAHAFPTKYKGKLVGTLDSDVTVFSFYANKTMTTAEGGMLVSKNPDIISRAKVMRLHGISRDAFDRYTNTKASWFYEVIAPGFKYNMPDINAAIGIHQLKKINCFYKKRVELANNYFNELSGLPIELPSVPVQTDSNHAFHLFPILINRDSNISRDDFISRMSEMDIGCSVHFIPLHRHPVWRDMYGLIPSDFSIAEDLYSREVSIPLYTKMTFSQQMRVIDSIKSIFR